MSTPARARALEMVRRTPWMSVALDDYMRNEREQEQKDIINTRNDHSKQNKLTSLPYLAEQDNAEPLESWFSTERYPAESNEERLEGVDRLFTPMREHMDKQSLSDEEDSSSEYNSSEDQNEDEDEDEEEEEEIVGELSQETVSIVSSSSGDIPLPTLKRFTRVSFAHEAAREDSQEIEMGEPEDFEEDEFDDL